MPILLIQIQIHNYLKSNFTNTKMVKNKGQLRGNASLCYAYSKSVDIALEVLDGSYIRFENDKNIKLLLVKYINFKKKDNVEAVKQNISNKRQILKLAARQAIDWDDTTTNNRLGIGYKELRIIVLKDIFDFNKIKDNDYIKLKKEIYVKCKSFSTIEKITIYSKNL